MKKNYTLFYLLSCFCMGMFQSGGASPEWEIRCCALLLDEVMFGR